MKMKKFLKQNGLALTLFAFFLVFVIGQSIAGYQAYNEQQMLQKQELITYPAYLISGDFVEALFENWESEFLQLGFYVFLTAFLFQKGSSESKSLTDTEPVDEDPKTSQRTQDVPWPVRKGGWILALYKHSLTVALLLFFLFSFILHAFGGGEAYCQELQVYGKPCIPWIEYLFTARFWFESLQNWQSEFFAMGVFIVLSIVLRQYKSPESKPVASPHWATGEEG